jgi:hypothetical protein
MILFMKRIVFEALLYKFVYLFKIPNEHSHEIHHRYLTPTPRFPGKIKMFMHEQTYVFLCLQVTIKKKFHQNIMEIEK